MEARRNAGNSTAAQAVRLSFLTACVFLCCAHTRCLGVQGLSARSRRSAITFVHWGSCGRTRIHPHATRARALHCSVVVSERVQRLRDLRLTKEVRNDLTTAEFALKVVQASCVMHACMCVCYPCKPCWMSVGRLHLFVIHIVGELAGDADGEPNARANHRL
jgi:hypothetical protein